MRTNEARPPVTSGAFFDAPSSPCFVRPSGPGPLVSKALEVAARRRSRIAWRRALGRTEKFITSRAELCCHRHRTIPAEMRFKVYSSRLLTVCCIRAYCSVMFRKAFGVPSSGDKIIASITRMDPTQQYLPLLQIITASLKVRCGRVGYRNQLKNYETPSGKDLPSRVSVRVAKASRAAARQKPRSKTSDNVFCTLGV